MNKKLVVAIASIGFGLSLNASAYWGAECNVAQAKSNYYCNQTNDYEACRYWINVVKRCGMDTTI